MSNKYRSSLKELQNPVLSFILVWSLFCLIRLYVGLHFLQFPWKTSFSSFYAFCVFCFESNLLNQDIKIYVLSCYVILLCNFVLTLYKNSPLINNTKLLIKILLLQKHAFREILSFSKKQSKIKECKISPAIDDKNTFS